MKKNIVIKLFGGLFIVSFFVLLFMKCLKMGTKKTLVLFVNQAYTCVVSN